jgi:hypothetical protein
MNVAIINKAQPVAKNGPVISKNNGNAPFFQPKLTVNQPNDSFEQEADAMADKVMRMPDTPGQHPFFKPSVNAVQRKCQACEEEDKFVRRKEMGGGDARGSEKLDHYVGSLGSSGQPLSDSSRSFFEPRFGHDFSDVRVHTDGAAAASAQSINASAYTNGNNIVFNQGQFSPQTTPGRQLIAHELTHVVQQGNQSKAIQRHRMMDGDEAKPCLQKAEQVIQTLEKNMGAGAGFGQQDYIKGAVQILRSKMSANKIKCYSFEGIIHGVTDYAGDEVRLDGVNLDWINETTVLHEGVHAYHASQHPDIAAKYAEALKAQKGLDPSKPADLKLLKWKAWTEYWAYRAKNDYYNPTRQTPMTEDEIHTAVMANPDVAGPVRNARQGDPAFNPRTYNP